VRKIMALADRANQYIDEHKPWIIAKKAGSEAEVVAVCTQGLNLFRALIVYLKPIVPALAARAETLLAAGELSWHHVEQPLLGARIAKFEALLTRVEQATVESLTSSTAGNREAAAVTQTSGNGAPTGGDIDIAEFQKTELRVARVIEASYVDGADKLLKLKLDVGNEERTVFSGIRSSYEPAALTNRLVILVANLAPRKMRFGVSQGMVLAASGDDPGIFLLSPDSGAKPGMKVS
jgi:methionyl-tRNA synthetase